LKEDVELNRQEAKDNRLDKVRVSSFSFDLPMLGILLTHPYPRHHLPPVDLLTLSHMSIYYSCMWISGTSENGLLLVNFTNPVSFGFCLFSPTCFSPY